MATEVKIIDTDADVTNPDEGSKDSTDIDHN